MEYEEIACMNGISLLYQKQEIYSQDQARVLGWTLTHYLPDEGDDAPTALVLYWLRDAERTSIRARRLGKEGAHASDRPVGRIIDVQDRTKDAILFIVDSDQVLLMDESMI